MSDSITKYVCPICGQEFKRYTYQIPEGKTPCCSKECAAIYKTGKKTRPHKFAASDKQLISEYLEGATLKQLAVKYGITFAAIAYRLKINGVERRKFSAFQTPGFYDTIREKQKASVSRGESHPRYKSLPIDEIKDLYLQGMKPEELSKRFEVVPTVILKRLREAGIEIRPRYLSQLAQDGHRVDSRLEMLVDNWLFAHHLEHVLHPKLPFNHHMRGDFLVLDTTYIEVFGMHPGRDGKYKERMTFKLQKYHEYNLPLLALYPPDFEAGGYVDLLVRTFAISD